MSAEAWLSFVTVFVASLVSACGIVVLFSLALRIGDSDAPARRAASLGLYILCGLIVVFGIYLIVPIFR
jgi:hypothetical protein